MGFNTVAFILNDFAHELADNPHATAFMVGHPYLGSREEHVRKQVESVAAEHGEKVPHSQALEMLPSFHASYRKFFTAGGNCITELKVLRTQKDRKTGKRVVVLELPDYLQDKSKF
jgi:hypothetical protein